MPTELRGQEREKIKRTSREKRNSGSKWRQLGSEGAGVRKVLRWGGQICVGEKKRAVDWSRFSVVSRLEDNVPAALLEVRCNNPALLKCKLF